MLQPAHCSPWERLGIVLVFDCCVDTQRDFPNAQHPTQILRNPLNKEYTLNFDRVPSMIYGIFHNIRGFGVSGHTPNPNPPSNSLNPTPSPDPTL